MTALVIMVAIIGLGSAVTVFSILNMGPPQVPPPETPPGNEQETVIDSGIQVWATAWYSQDFMPMVGPDGPPFGVHVRVNITNNGAAAVEGFDALRVTIYFNNTISPLITLNLSPAEEWEQCPPINPGESLVIRYRQSSERVFSPSIEQGTYLYSRVLIVWGDSVEHILTTCPSALFFTY